MVVGVVWFVLGFGSIAAGSRFRVQGMERIAYLVVYVLFVLPVSHQTYSQARAERALIAADDVRRPANPLAQKTSIIFKILYLIVTEDYDKVR